MRKIVFVVLLFAGVVGFAPPVSAVVPGAPYTDTGCDGLSDGVARLYVAAFGRIPEENGFNFWLEQYSTAQWTLPEMAAFFVTSAEFEERYGAIEDDGFVIQLYENVLGRAPDDGGLEFWTNELVDGLSRGDLLLRFSESPENIERSGTAEPTLGDFNAGATGPFDCDGAELVQLCDAFLFLLFSGETIDLAEALGDDAPSGLLAAIDTLNDPDADFEDQLAAFDSLEGYVEPICRDRWDRDLMPASTNAVAVATFFNALVAGDEAAAEPVAPDDVRARFGATWISIPDNDEVGSPSFSYDGGDTFSMLLAPTITVACTVDDGVVTSCGFGE